MPSYEVDINRKRDYDALYLPKSWTYIVTMVRQVIHTQTTTRPYPYTESILPHHHLNVFILEYIYSTTMNSTRVKVFSKQKGCYRYYCVIMQDPFHISNMTFHMDESLHIPTITKAIDLNSIIPCPCFKLTFSSELDLGSALRVKNFLANHLPK
jgi:hypothetical protein